MFHVKFNLSDKLYHLACIVLLFVAISLTINGEGTYINGVYSSEECELVKVFHVLEHVGCEQKRVPSFACRGRCRSSLRVSGHNFWKMERSCTCCQEIDDSETHVRLSCLTELGEKFNRTVKIRAPLECLCRPCTSINEGSVYPQEMLDFPNEPAINGHFVIPSFN